MRLEDWDVRLAAVVERHHDLAGAWGISDCFLFAMDCVEAVTGTDPYADERGRYSDAAGAAERLKARGFRSVEAAIAAVFDSVPVAMAQRGDLGVTRLRDGTPACVVFVPGGVIGRGERGLVRLPRSVVKRAFEVR